ncbi:lipid IV(A) 3-deoxy-D-manno-octulosonic acid transferase [Uliginosibacterium sediminicola]|uniref:3-deoxy-D-manno-octulosonic acid transferase n=1 Tax=Uliginosibacterium sediminicola TaxID=2024550 RepID=A0ABU9Z2K7_9RHOO
MAALSRFAYSLLWALGMPLVLGRLLWRARRQPEYLHQLGERFARIEPTRQPTIWLHAVSVGETRAAEPLVKALLAAYPEHRILLTHMTPTGRATGKSLFGKFERVQQSWLPYDLPWLARRFLRRVQPEAGIIMETEVWPNLMHAAQRLGVPMLLANARLSARSARGYARLGGLSREAFAGFAQIAAQSEADAQRLRAAGGRAVQVCGNIKYEVEIPAGTAETAARFRSWCVQRPVLLAASTRDGEEALLLDAFSQLAPPGVLLVLVPRHPQRFDEVATLAAQRGLVLARRSSAQPIGEQVRVWLGDSMGEMAAYYAMADVALIGGSWLPFGSQNLIEACAAGVPVMIGPSSFNFAEAAELAIAAGAARRCSDPLDGMRVALSVLAQATLRAQMGAAGREFCARHSGATARVLALLRPLMRG